MNVDEVLARIEGNLDTAMSDLTARIATLEGTPRELTEAERTSLVQQVVGVLQTTPDQDGFVRKLTFAGGDDRLKGSKYARLGLSAADIEFLYDLQSSLRNQRKVAGGGVYNGPSESLEQAFKDVSDASYMSAEEVRELGIKELDDVFPRVPRTGRRYDQRGYEAAVRAMDSAESGYGNQLIGAQYVGELWDAARPSSRIFNLIDAFEMSAPTAYLPVEADLPEMFFVAENTADNSSEYSATATGSNRVTVAAKKFIIHQWWSGELEEDSIIPFVPFLRRQAAASLAHYSDSLVVNGDDTNAATGNINLDDADPSDTKHYLAFDGIRHAAIVDNTNNKKDVGGAAHTVQTYLTLKSYMQQAAAYQPMHWGWPLRFEDLVFAMDFSTYHQSLNLDEVVTLDKMGAGATLLNGQLGAVWGHPIIPTQVVPLTEADGKPSTTGSNNTLGQIVAFNRNAFKVGWRRRVMLETERLPGRDQTRLIYSLRLGFGRYSVTGAASGIEAAAVAYNIAV